MAGFAGLASFIYGLVESKISFALVGAFVMLVGFAFPRLKGKIEIALGALRFKGELISEDRDESEGGGDSSDQQP